MPAATATLFTFWWLLAGGILCGVVLLAPAPRWGSPWPVIGLAIVFRAVPLLAFKLIDGSLIQFDWDSYRIAGDTLRARGDVYDLAPERHPYLPLSIYWLAAAGWLADHTPLPFAPLVKMPGVIADIGVVALLWTSTGLDRARRAALVYALNPVSVFVVAVHGQIDSLPVFFLLASVYVLREATPDTRSTLFAGGLLGLAITSKTWPVALAPLLVWGLGGRERRLSFLVGSAAVPALAVVVYLVAVWTGPGALLSTVTDYQGVPNSWGYKFLLERYRDATPISENLYALAGYLERFILLGALALATVLAARMALERGVALVVMTLLVFTHGWGQHYVMWPLAFALLAWPRWRVGVYLASAAFMIGALAWGFGGVYYWAVWQVGFVHRSLEYRWLIPVFMWLICIGLLGMAAADPIRRLGRRLPARRSLPTPDGKSAPD